MLNLFAQARQDIGDPEAGAHGGGHCQRGGLQSRLLQNRP